MTNEIIYIATFIFFINTVVISYKIWKGLGDD